MVGLLSLIGVAMVIRRAAMLLMGAPSDTGRLDAGFAAHRALTMAHIVPGLVFVVLGPWQFVEGLRSRRPALHRWMGRGVAGAGFAVGVTALAMGPQMAIGGRVETAATMFFGCVFLAALVRALAHAMRGEFGEHREWMIRAYGTGLAVATIRPIVGVFFALERVTGMGPEEFFGIAFWIGFTVQLVAAEAWIGYTRGRAG